MFKKIILPLMLLAVGGVAVTLVVIGDQDVVGSNHVAQAEVLAKRIPGSEHKILKGQSHGFFWQVPEDTNSWIIAWVLSHASETA